MCILCSHKCIPLSPQLFPQKRIVFECEDVLDPASIGPLVNGHRQWNVVKVSRGVLDVFVGAQWGSRCSSKLTMPSTHEECALCACVRCRLNDTRDALRWLPAF